MAQQDDGLTINKLDYLQGKYIFRYPYTFTSIKWGLTLGSFFGIHTYVRSRNFRNSFISWIQKTVVFTFLVWGYFYAKYNFYQDSINEHEKQQDQKMQQSLFLRKYIEFKLKIPSTITMTEQELLNEYQKYGYEQMERNFKLDLMLTNIKSNTFDL